MAKNLEIAMLFDFYGGLLTAKQQEAVDLYYNNDLSLAEIAENQGITRQGVRDAVKRAESQLLEMEAQLGLVARFRRMNRTIRDIGAAAEDILAANQAVGSAAIGKSADAILRLSKKLDD